MLAAAFEISVQCPKCDAWVPLPGPLLRLHCDKCQTDFELKRRLWFRLLRDVYAEIGFRLEDGQGYNAEAVERYAVKALYGRQRPVCLGCGEAITPAEDAAAAYDHTCSRCEATTRVTPPPAWLANALTPPRWLLNAEIQEEKGTESSEKEGEKKEAAASPVAFTCPQCAGSLLVDGRDRMIRCNYCGVDVYLPDELWFRLHPARKKRRWFVVYGEIRGDRVPSQMQLLRRTSPYIVKMYERTGS
jgi:hypothetical protein